MSLNYFYFIIWHKQWRATFLSVYHPQRPIWQGMATENILCHHRCFFALDSLPTVVFLGQTTTHLLLCSPPPPSPPLSTPLFPSNQSTYVKLLWTLDSFAPLPCSLLILRLDRPSRIKWGGGGGVNSRFTHRLFSICHSIFLTSQNSLFHWSRHSCRTLVLNIMNSKPFRSFHVYPVILAQMFCFLWYCWKLPSFSGQEIARIWASKTASYGGKGITRKTWTCSSSARGKQKDQKGRLRNELQFQCQWYGTLQRTLQGVEK